MAQGNSLGTHILVTILSEGLTEHKALLEKAKEEGTLCLVQMSILKHKVPSSLRR
jgi:hypothetical protein